MVSALTVLGIYEMTVWTGLARAATGIIAADIAIRTFKNASDLCSKVNVKDKRKWVDLGKNTAATAFFGFCTVKNCPTVAVVGLLFYGIYALIKGAQADAYVTAKYLRMPVAYASSYLPAKCRMTL